MEGINKTSQMSMHDLVGPFCWFSIGNDETNVVQIKSWDVSKIGSNPGVRSDLFNRPLYNTRITDFFGGVAQVEVESPNSFPEGFVVCNESDSIEKESVQVTSTIPTSSPTSMFHHVWLYAKARKHFRTWAALVIIGSLVGWVGFVKR